MTVFVRVLLCLAFVAAAAPLPAAAGDDSGVAALLARSAAAWNRGDLDAFMRSYENSPQTVYVGSKRIFHGYAAIRAHYALSYGTHKTPPNKSSLGSLSFSDLAVRPLGPEYAVVVARWHLALANGKHPSGIFSLVLHRSGGGWHIVVDHSP